MRNTLSAAMCSVLFVACGGLGSEVGPRLARLPQESSKVVVQDDQGRGVVDADVSIVGSSLRALTGRNGRGDLLAAPRARQRIRIDGAQAAAVAADQLGVLVVAQTLSGGDLPGPFHLPDVRDSMGRQLFVGSQIGAATLDDAATSGARLTIGAGTSIGVGSGAATVTIRTGKLQPEHLPGDLPSHDPANVTSGPLLFSRGIYVDPPAVTLTPAASLDVVDDLSLASGTATLFHLDSDTGEWTAVANGVTASGGRLALANAVAKGGLYVFAAAVVGGSVVGRVVDAATPPGALRDMMVNVDGRHTTTDAAGRFFVTRVPSTLADGTPRTAVIEVFSGGSWLPARTTTTAAMSGAATIEVGDLALDTVAATNVRVQLVKRGRAEAFRRSTLSSLFAGVAMATASDRDGQTIFEDVPARWFGFQDGHPLDSTDNFYVQAISFVEPGVRSVDAYQFYGKRAWFIGSRRSRVLITDALAGGPLYDAPLVVGSSDNTGFFGYSRESGTLFADRNMSGRATATFRSVRDGRTIVHAYSIETPNGEHVELPMQQVLRTPLGAFDRHGMVNGTLTGADPAREHRLRVTRRFELQEWWEDLVEGRALPSSLPVDVDPAATHGEFRAGVPVAGGHLVATESTVAGGRTTLQKIGILADVEPVEGTALARDLPLDLPAVTSFLAPQALVGIDSMVAVADLTAAFALEQPSGRAIDIARDVGGNHTAVGSDLQFMLPALTGSLAGHRWIVLLQGSATGGGATVVQRSLLRLSAGSAAAVPLLDAPAIAAPLPGATVAASGFTMQFTLPPGVLHATIELRSDSGSELYLWQVLLPPGSTEFKFPMLPAEAHKPLVAGKTYSLTLSAYRALAGPLAGRQFSYPEVTSFVQSLGAVERGVDAVASRTIQVIAN